MQIPFTFPYTAAPAYQKKVAYFCMEYGIHQPLKIYAGGLGFLAGSYLRSAYELQQNMVGIGILWKYGYYDQVRKQDQSMDVLFAEKNYGFLEPTGIKFTIRVSRHDVWVTAFYLPPDIFNTAPLFLLSTDLEENDYLAKTISHKLYDSNPETRIASAILLGAGGARLLEELGWVPDTYHLNESHALPLAFYLYAKYKNTDAIKKQLVFTNHTPEPSGNQRTNLGFLEKMGFFCEVPLTEISAIAAVAGQDLDHTATALRLSGKANGVSKMHHGTLSRLWTKQEGACKIGSITNAQNFTYWHNKEMYRALHDNDDRGLVQEKLKGKSLLFEEVADQNGEIYDERICTIVFAKRFAGYKRADLFFQDMDRFHRLVTNKERPVQIIWAGKPYPVDYAAIGVFDKVVNICKTYTNCSILVGYELKLSKILKQGADVWLNVPRLTHEASGTSGMTAAMNGSVNVGLPDGWLPEFARDKINSFVVPPCDPGLPDHEQDDLDAASLYKLLETEVLPMFYDYPDRWLGIMKNSMTDIIPQFDSNRMAREYYDQIYT
ncbi:alpha-glucan family phosphorylase [Flavihumibacter fluvii]|uniref:alpha-glucan family phosphorylase n=1 Tax=Flavihumibacter fluvii TaxID=2838157 RepID=UPI001BDF0D45|nr:alpha-glucan family phosphorylase [Flavihumibacter fluvii]ULQ53322.1 alpha-glucan family phosphorylase [Flavihumibacter fluvii]